MKRSELKVGKRYWFPSVYDTPMRKRLKGFSTTADRVYFGVRYGGWNIARLPHEVFETKKECRDYINQEEQK